MISDGSLAINMSATYWELFKKLPEDIVKKYSNDQNSFIEDLVQAICKLHRKKILENAEKKFKERMLNEKDYREILLNMDKLDKLPQTELDKLFEKGSK